MSSNTVPPPAAGVPPFHVPEGTPFHRLGRTTSRYRWWRPVLGTVIVLVAAWLYDDVPAFIVRTVLGHTGDLPVLRHVTDITLSLAGAALTLPLVLGVTRILGARPAATLFSVTGRIRWRWLSTCLLVAAPVVLAIPVTAVVLILAGTHHPVPAAAATVPPLSWATPISLVVLIAVGALASAAEETLSRGWLLQAAGSFARNPWPAIVVPALLLSALDLLGGQEANTWGITGLLLHAVIAGWLTVRTGGLEAAVALHVAYNCLPAIMAVLRATDRTTDPDATVAFAHWQLVAAQTAGFVIYAAIIVRLSRRRVTATAPAAPAVSAVSHDPCESLPDVTTRPATPAGTGAPDDAEPRR